MRAQVAIAILMGALCACSGKTPAPAAAPAQSAPPAAAVAPLAETDPSAQDDANDVAIWVHPSDPARSLVLGTAGTAGLELFGLDGHRKGSFDGAELDHLDVIYGFDAGGGPGALVVGYDRRSGGLLAFTIDPQSFRVSLVSPRPMLPHDEVTGLCGYQSGATGKHYVFASTDAGDVQQWELFAKGGRVDGRLVRTIPVGVGAGYCVVDEDAGDLYVAEEKAGIWKIPAEPETDAERSAVDLAGSRGHIEDEVSGLALYRAGGKGYLIAADVKPARFNVYSLADSAFLGAFTLGAAGGIDAVGESEGLEVSSLAMADSTPGGLLVVMDEDNDGAAGNLKLVAWKSIAAAMNLDAPSGGDPRAALAAPEVAPIEPIAETDPVDNYGDAADDPAIWVHPTNPARSLIIAAQKKRGIYVYGLDGKTQQVLADGRMNNVDVRDGFRLGTSTVPIVAATNRTDKTLALYRIDAAQGRLAAVSDGKIPTGFADHPYGLCMYRSARSGDVFVFANGAGDGAYKQWKLVAKGNKVGAELVREFTVGSQAEGCATDDETGALYISEEDVGLWRYSAEPDGGTARTQIDTTEKGHLKADVEGLSVYAGKGGTGYIVLSNQGANDYALYRREGKNEFVGHFAVVANDELGVDGASETDGLDVTSAALGAGFSHGLLVVQDGRNISPRERQNFKLVPWDRVVAGMKLKPPAE